MDNAEVIHVSEAARPRTCTHGYQGNRPERPVLPGHKNLISSLVINVKQNISRITRATPNESTTEPPGGGGGCEPWEMAPSTQKMLLFHHIRSIVYYHCSVVIKRGQREEGEILRAGLD